MADTITGIFDSKRINELSLLAKLNGKEYMLIDNTDTTMKTTVDTLLGYIRDQINASQGQDTSSAGSCIEIIPIGESIPAESRPKNHFYLNVSQVSDVQQTLLTKTLKVSPNMGLSVQTN